MILNILITLLKDLSSNYLLVMLYDRNSHSGILGTVRPQTSSIVFFIEYLLRVREREKNSRKGKEGRGQAGLFLRTWTLEYLDFNPGPFIW